MRRERAPVASLQTSGWVGVPAGWFLMGSPEGQGRQEERPAHRVWVEAFDMARYQVTNREYAVFLAATGQKPPPLWGGPAFSAPEQPAAGPSWFDAMAYCHWLSGKTGQPYRLPTEAEWERAARGGAKGHLFPWGDRDPTQRPNYHQRWKQGPEPVGTAPPNAYGIFDLCENLHEWCLDWYDAGFYAISPERNPACAQPRSSPPRRASRGGSWRHHIKISRCAARSSIPPSFQYADYGFRMVRSALSFPGLT